MSGQRWEDELQLAEMTAGVTPIYLARGFDRPLPDISDVLAGRLPRARHLLALWEPLLTKAPSPSRCQPYCCYICTVIFYHRPYISGPPRGGRDLAGVFHRDWNRGFFEYDQIETRLRSDDVVAFDGDEWDVGGGHVHWHRKRWWMRRWARRAARA